MKSKLKKSVKLILIFVISFSLIGTMLLGYSNTPNISDYISENQSQNESNQSQEITNQSQEDSNQTHLEINPLYDGFDEYVTKSNGEKVHKYIWAVGTDSVGSDRSPYKWGVWYLSKILNKNPTTGEWGNLRYIRGYQQNYCGYDDGELIEGQIIDSKTDSDYDIPSGKNHNSNHPSIEIVDLKEVPNPDFLWYGDEYLNPNRLQIQGRFSSYI
ncbi:MAG: hypothetical protein LBT66_00285 [Methanobrevibacter sp.]|nr:hypothetical protein [Candidatus Methanovirga meridionalis]